MKLIKFIFIFLIICSTNSFASNTEEFIVEIKFQKSFSKQYFRKTFEITMAHVKFLPKVIEYDRFQPEFYEDTKTYISKRTSNKKLNSGINFYANNRKLINRVETELKLKKNYSLR